MTTYKTVDESALAYTYYLKPKLSKIYAQAFYYNVSVDELKKNVYNYIYKAAYSWKDSNGKTHFTRKKEFIENLNALENNAEIYWYCVNSVNKAKITEAK